MVRMGCGGRGVSGVDCTGQFSSKCTSFQIIIFFNHIIKLLFFKWTLCFESSILSLQSFLVYTVCCWHITQLAVAIQTLFIQSCNHLQAQLVVRKKSQGPSIFANTYGRAQSKKKFQNNFNINCFSLLKLPLKCLDKGTSNSIHGP